MGTEGTLDGVLDLMTTKDPSQLLPRRTSDFVDRWVVHRNLDNEEDCDDIDPRTEAKDKKS